MLINFHVFVILCSFLVLSFSQADSTTKPNPFDTRIFGGEQAIPYQFPWFAFVVPKDAQGMPYGSCGGSLIASNYVLTAAHCCSCDDPSAPVSSFGISLNLQEADYLYYEPISDQCTENHEATTRICHPDYRKESPENDFCLIKLEEPSEYTPIVVYGTQKQTIIPTLDGYNDALSIAGFGVFGEQDRISDTLQKAMILVANTSNCIEKYANKSVVLDPAVLVCANTTATNTDACQGDSGGPLFTFRSGKFYLVGVAALGPSGCQAGNELDSLYGRVNSDSFRKFLSSAISLAPTSLPTRRPTTAKPQKITKVPTVRRTKAPTPFPSKRPTKAPTVKGSTRAPTEKPTKRAPTARSTRSPVTRRPTNVPTTKKTRSPTTRRPTGSPTTRSPTTARPTRAPTFSSICNNPRYP